MIITKLILENIRSYKNQTIQFPEGSILLSGDIGSGKSSILLSIEFVLFGFRRADLSGSTLLRHGEKQGSVELHFKIGNRNVIIKRSLKRGPSGVKQDNGYIVLNAMKEDMTAQELKSKVIEILGYPSDLLSKSNESIYRYTVYTPQEEMKHIIFADTQSRLDILRRVFGVDKYKRIKENIMIYSRELKGKIRYLSGQIEDLGSLQKEKEELNDQLKGIDNKSLEQNKKKEKLGVLVDKKRDQLEKYQKQNTDLEKSRNERKIMQVKASQYKENILNSKSRIELITKRIVEDKKVIDELKDIDEEKLNRFLKEVSSKIEDYMEKRSRLLQETAVIVSDNKKAEKLSFSIRSLKDCPTCKQNVDINHKECIEKDASELISLNNIKMQKMKEMISKIDNNLRILKKKKEETQNLLNESNKKVLIKRAICEKEEERTNIEQNIIEEERRIARCDEDIKSVDGRIIGLEKGLEDYEPFKKEYDVLNKDYQGVLQESSRIKQKMADLKERIDSLSKKIENKMLSKKNMEKLSSLLTLFESSFTPLVALMEKQVMGSIHYEFNEIISKWFGLLIDEEMLTLRLDNEFNPVLEQNGYETSIDNLSGGEKTAVALSYRLALNRVINDMISNINTKDLLILDEPTDGFSNEELDKLNDVLHELNTKQLIIVSHDSKIEGFVDNHLRVEKTGHESIVMD